MAVSLSEFEKAVLSLKKALDAKKDDIPRDATIQRFEFCVELSWKVSKKIIGTSSSAPKTVIREMAQNKLISKIDLWLESIDQRNLSSLTYNEELAEEVYEFAKNFYHEFEGLLKELKKT